MTKAILRFFDLYFIAQLEQAYEEEKPLLDLFLTKRERESLDAIEKMELIEGRLLSIGFVRYAEFRESLGPQEKPFSWLFLS